jgi:hypothetical protein
MVVALTLYNPKLILRRTNRTPYLRHTRKGIIHGQR